MHTGLHVVSFFLKKNKKSQIREEILDFYKAIIIIFWIIFLKKVDEWL